MKSLLMGYRFWKLRRWIQKQKKRRIQIVARTGQSLDGTMLCQTVDAIVIGQTELSCALEEITLRLDILIQAMGKT